MAEDFFVSVRNPDEFKRNLAEGSQSLLNVIELERRIEMMVDERERNFEVLAGNLEEIKKLLSHLEHMLPKKEVPLKKVKTIKRSGISAIEKELADIDDKLNAVKKSSKR